MPDKRTILKGNGIGDYVSIGDSFLYLNSLITPMYNIEKEDIEEEYLRLDKAIEQSKEQIEYLIKNVDNNLKNILSMHILLIQDAVIIKQVKNEVKEKLLNVEYVYDSVITEYFNRISAFNNQMLSERASDIIDIKGRVIRNLLNPSTDNSSFSIPKDCIVISKTLTPSDVLKFNSIGVGGFIVEGGGYTSHAAILAKSFGIPTIFNVENITNRAKNDRKIIIDCRSNIVILNPNDKDTHNYTLLSENLKKYKEQSIKDAKEKAITKDNVEIKINANIDIPDEMESVIKYGVDSIGLYRTEFLYIYSDDGNSCALPTEERQFNVYKKIASSANGKVIIRTLDIGGDKMAPSLGVFNVKEDNPFLGWRAIRFCLSNKKIFRNQIRALLRASVYGNIEIMIPMISTLEEFLDAKKFINEVKEELKNENIAYNDNIKIGALVETPSAAIIIDLLIEETDFISIGSNDLTQYILACDRTNEKLTYLYNPLDISVLRILKHIIKTAKDNNKLVTLCGEMGGVPKYTPILLGLGIRELSMSVTSIAEVKNIIRAVSIEECEKLVNSMLENKNNDFSKSVLESFIKKLQTQKV